jgi:hypothetical protein
MKNLKYIKLFEAFESTKLSKTLGFIKDKKTFIDYLKNIANKIDLPYSKYSDDYFQYLPFKKALELNHSIIDESCDATSAGEFPEYRVEGEKCTNGHLKRKWGRGVRSVICPVCKGTGIKPKTTFDIKWIKFWFDKDGNYVNTTITDGKVRDQESRLLKDYDIVKRITRMSQWNSVETGTKVRITIDTKNVIGTYFKEDNTGRHYIIQNIADGSEPGTNDWKKYGKYSWNITGGEYTGTPEILKPVSDEEERIDPYTWNALYDISRSRILNNSDVEVRLSNAHFAIILDFLDLKKSGFKTRRDIKSEREESVKGALAFISDDEIKNKNIERYIEELAKRINIPRDLADFQKVIIKYMGSSKIGYYVLRGRNFSDLNSFIDKIYTFMTSPEENEWYYESALNDLKVKHKYNNRFNMEVEKDIRETYKKIPEERKIILKKLEELNITIFYKISALKIENLNDIEILWEKMSSIRNIWKNSSRFKHLRELYYGVENLSDGYRLNRYIGDMDSSNIENVVNDIDRFIEVIKNF